MNISHHFNYFFIKNFYISFYCIIVLEYLVPAQIRWRALSVSELTPYQYDNKGGVNSLWRFGGLQKKRNKNVKKDSCKSIFN